MRAVLTLTQAEEISGIPRERLRRAIRAGRLTAVKEVHPDAGDGWTPAVSQAWLVTETDLRMYLKNRGRQVRPDRRELLRVVEDAEQLIRRALKDADAQGGYVGNQLLQDLSECANKLGVARRRAE